MKKFSAILLALVLVLAMSATAFAASITVNDSNAVTGQTYKAYKIFDATRGTGDAISYSIAANSKYLKAVQALNDYVKLTLAADGTSYSVEWVNELSDKETAQAFAKALEAEIKKLTPAVSPDYNIEVNKQTDVAEGYYLIVSPVGAKVIAATTDVEVNEKNEYPSDKKEPESTTAKVGDTVEYTITVTIPAGANQAITVHDTMTNLVLAGDIKVQVNGTDVEDGKYTIYNPATDNLGHTFDVVLHEDYVTELGATGATVVITYSATVTADAAVDGSFTNTEYLSYGDYTSKPNTPEGKTYEFKINKTDKNGNPLLGAEFKLYDAETGGNEIKVVAVKDKDTGALLYYRVAEADEQGEVIVAGTNVVVKGLKGNTIYWLEETKAPDGYNKLANRAKVEIGADNTLVVDVVNYAGSELPETGGMGTTIFYVVGGLMMAAAVVILVAKKKVAAEK